MSLTALRAAFVGYFRAFDADEADAPAFRARQLQAVLRLTPVAMGVNVLNAVLVAVALGSQVSPVFLLPWMLAVTVLAVLGLRGWWSSSRRPARATASARALNRALVQASVLALAWAALPAFQFARVDPSGQFLIGMVTTGMICAGGLALSSLPVAASSYVLILSLGAALALALSGAPRSGPISLLLLAYAVIVIYSVWNYARTLGAQMVAEARADRQNEVISLLLRDFEDHTSDLLWELDAHGRFTHVSQRLAALLRLDARHLARWPALALLGRLVPPGDDARQAWAALRRQLARGTAFRDQVVSLLNAGAVQWWSLSARPLFDDAGRPLGWRGVATDITDKQRAHRRLSWLAHNDALTGLVNRTQFRERLQALLGDGGPAVTPVAVISFDLDGFKQVNDTHGHAAGDQMLQAFGQRLLEVARRSDTVARLGGDEFAMMVRGVSGADDLQPLLDRVQAALAPACEVAGHKVALRASIGVALAPADGHDVDALMSNADMALYVAKNAGGNGHRFFHASMAEVGRRRSTLQDALRGAVERGEFRLEFQPQVSADGARVHGFEALLRWKHPEHGPVSPAEFVPMAETAGLMPRIGDWVLFEACRQARSWPPGLRVSINVSATQLGSADFVSRVQAAAQGLRPAQVELEITESALIDEADKAEVTLTELRARGFQLALDDFGTGYSALNYLRRYPFDTLKIDRSFVHDLASDGEAQVLVETILAMARALRLSTVAEGVERPAEAQMLRARGCSLLQGYLVSRPLPAHAVQTFLDRWDGFGQGVELGAEADAVPA